MKLYETIQGDTFDIISKKAYDNERLVQKLLDSNPKQIKTIVFSAGVMLKIPEATQQEMSTQSQPPWRTA